MPDHWQPIKVTPFAQGYIEALFATLDAQGPADPMTADPSFVRRTYKVSDLSPEALALILRDCERFNALEVYGDGLGGGEAFWRDRKDGDFTDFPPLRVFLRDDGKVGLDPASASGSGMPSDV